MSITKILATKDVDSEEILADVAAVVAGARENYGNTDADIAVPVVNTVNGAMPFDMLDADGKVALLQSEVGRVKAQAIEFTTQNPGTNLNRKIEELLATNGLFANIAPETEFAYI